MGVLNSCGPCDLATLSNGRIGPRAAELRHETRNAGPLQVRWVFETGGDASEEELRWAAPDAASASPQTFVETLSGILSLCGKNWSLYAFQDPLNERFLMLSESCVPLRALWRPVTSC